MICAAHTLICSAHIVIFRAHTLICSAHAVICSAHALCAAEISACAATINVCAAQISACAAEINVCAATITVCAAHITLCAAEISARPPPPSPSRQQRIRSHRRAGRVAHPEVGRHAAELRKPLELAADVARLLHLLLAANGPRIICSSSTTRCGPGIKYQRPYVDPGPDARESRIKPTSFLEA